MDEPSPVAGLIEIDVDGVEELVDLEEAATAIELRPTREDQNERLDRFVAMGLPSLSRSYVQVLIDDGCVLVDGFARKPKFKMTPGQVVTVRLPSTVVVELRPEPIPLQIVFEDDDVIVLIKPAGLVVHPAPGHPSGTLVNALLFHAPSISIAGSNRPGLVHRLDKDTSGLMVVAKTDRARNSLVAQWEARTVGKAYVALVSGVVAPDEGTIEAPIRRDPKQRQRMAVGHGGRGAISHFTVRRRYPAATLLDVKIETGRTHQIRVHLAFIGHPVVGDAVYGRAGGGSGPIVPRHFLHASRLAFNLPDGRRVEFESPLPVELQAVLDGMDQAEREGTE